MLFAGHSDGAAMEAGGSHVSPSSSCPARRARHGRQQVLAGGALTLISAAHRGDESQMFGVPVPLSRTSRASWRLWACRVVCLQRKWMLTTIRIRTKVYLAVRSPPALEARREDRPPRSSSSDSCVPSPPPWFYPSPNLYAGFLAPPWNLGIYFFPTYPGVCQRW